MHRLRYVRRFLALARFLHSKCAAAFISMMHDDPHLLMGFKRKKKDRRRRGKTKKKTHKENEEEAQKEREKEIA